MAEHFNNSDSAGLSRPEGEVDGAAAKLAQLDRLSDLQKHIVWLLAAPLENGWGGKPASNKEIASELRRSGADPRATDEGVKAQLKAIYKNVSGFGGRSPKRKRLAKLVHEIGFWGKLEPPPRKSPVAAAGRPKVQVAVLKALERAVHELERSVHTLPGKISQELRQLDWEVRARGRAELEDRRLAEQLGRLVDAITTATQELQRERGKRRAEIATRKAAETRAQVETNARRKAEEERERLAQEVARLHPLRVEVEALTAELRRERVEREAAERREEAAKGKAAQLREELAHTGRLERRRLVPALAVTVALVFTALAFSGVLGGDELKPVPVRAGPVPPVLATGVLSVRFERVPGDPLRTHRASSRLARDAFGAQQRFCRTVADLTPRAKRLRGCYEPNRPLSWRTDEAFRKQAKHGTFGLYTVKRGWAKEQVARNSFGGRVLGPTREGIYWEKSGSNPPIWVARKAFGDLVLEWYGNEDKRTDESWRRLVKILNAHG
jgi:hypothetical protein